MDSLIRKHMKTPFTNDDITRFTKCPLLVYDDLYKFDNIDQVLGKSGCAIILYQIEPNVGHWVCLTKNNKNQIEFFDSYGNKPDDQFKFATYNRMNGQKYLSELLINSKYEIVYNPYKLQAKGFNMATCGRWVTLRLHMRDIPVCTFAKMFMNQSFKPDWYACALTMFIS